MRVTAREIRGDVGAVFAQDTQHALRVCADAKRDDFRSAQSNNARQRASENRAWQIGFDTDRFALCPQCTPIKARAGFGRISSHPSPSWSHDNSILRAK
jgi:hypothetical protein